MESAHSAKDALLRGQNVEVSANLGQISTQLEVANDLGVGPAQTFREGTSSSTVVSPITYQSSPIVVSGPTPAAQNVATVQTPIKSAQSQPGLLPPLIIEPDAASRRPPPSSATLQGSYFAAQVSDLSPDVGLSSLQSTPPLLHSHSFPNGHQLPSQLHSLTPSTPLLPSPSFTSSLGIPHVPLVSSPLAGMSISRPPSPPVAYAMPQRVWDDTTLYPNDIAEQSYDGRLDGRPVISRARSTSVHKSWQSLQNLTTSMPPTAWQSRQASPEEEDDEESEDEGPKRLKRRRSSGRDEAPDPGMIHSLVISDDIRRQLDQIFEEFLNRICSDRTSCISCADISRRV